MVWLFFIAMKLIFWRNLNTKYLVKTFCRTRILFLVFISSKFSSVITLSGLLCQISCSSCEFISSSNALAVPLRPSSVYNFTIRNFKRLFIYSWSWMTRLSSLPLVRKLRHYQLWKGSSNSCSGWRQLMCFLMAQNLDEKPPKVNASMSSILQDACDFVMLRKTFSSVLNSCWILLLFRLK